MSICKCGKEHTSSVKYVVAEKNAISQLPEFIKLLNASKPFILADKNTYAAAGEKVCEVLRNANITFSKYVYSADRLAPDEKTVGSAIMHYDSSCDVVIGIGSGVINDTCKILSKVSKTPYVIVATAPSMDGYASATSSMDCDGLKTSLPTKCPEVIIGDIDVLKNAPTRMLISGLGDMLAKYISICEWRISNLVTGEYYCEYVASLVRNALKKCVDNAGGLLSRDEEAVKAVFEGLTLGGMAMEYAGLSRPASGIEHSLSHVWDMRGLEFGTKTDFHGIQCGVATLYALKLYEQLKHVTPDVKKAEDYITNFDVQKWNEQLLDFIGEGARKMIALEEKEKKYDVEKQKKQIRIIADNWQTILRIIDEELPPVSTIENLLDRIQAPKTCTEIGIDESILPMVFKASKDLRDKFILSRLCHILGIIDEMKF